MRKNRLRKAVLAASVPIGASLFAASMAGAQTATYTNTYDTAGSIETIPGGDFNPSTQNWRFEYGASTPTSNHSVGWTNTQDNTGNSGGSVELHWIWSASSDGSGSAAFTADTFPFANTLPEPGYQVTQIKFDLMVGPGSTIDTYGGYGYFQMFARNESYGGFTGLINEELDATIGQWQTFTVNFATPVPVRAITFQDYNDTTRDMNGPENWFIDNMSVTYNVPEPASLGLLGLGVPALMLRRRSKVKTG
jgi:hypothetical protein